ncbi:hypothetical protein KP509_07G006700 [Ceratopteris richardii]|uniref:Uncharacterized protein n=1 Tax=Ceratopteris richardii TaxID=49495 RepID=A0A8T2UE56_CERRI|nr:hypothetical protein KP509_07G006700 [Ceratopteris richardii]
MERRLQQRAKLGSVSVLEVAGEGALSDLLNLLQAYLPSKDTERSNEAPSDQVIWVHLGVNSGASKFAIERRAINEATFRCPDEMGWKPQRSPIVAADGLSHVRETDFPVPELVDSLVKKGFNVALSDDAAR